MKYAETVLSELKQAISMISEESTDALISLILSSDTIFCHGLGRSGLNARAFAMRLMHIGKNVCIVGDTLANPIKNGDLLILVSASGSSPAMTHIAECAKKHGAKIAVITTNVHAPVCAEASCVVAINAPTKVEGECECTSALPMGTLFEESSYLMLDMMILEMMDRMHLKNQDLVSRHANLE